MSSAPGWRCRDRELDLSDRPLVMAVLNVTPDSFSDGGRYADPAAAIARARELAAAGADILDLGGESTRPGSEAVAPEEQWRRLEPVVRALAAPDGPTLSIDTRDAQVADWGLTAGAHIVNDVSALGDPAMTAVVARHRAGLVLMHMQGVPGTMQQKPSYEDVVREVAAFLGERSDRAIAAGVPREAIALDPGIGFGKAIEHNMQLVARLDELARLGFPVVIGASRKSFIGRMTGAEVHDRLPGSIAMASIAIFQGARIVRAHDVAETLQAVRIAEAVRSARR